MDKAAVLAYCRLKSKAGNYICCEIVFTVVYSVVVAATSVYRQTNKSQGQYTPICEALTTSITNISKQNVL